MTPAPDPTVARVAAGLTAARKALLLKLPADGSWGKASSRAVAKRAWYDGFVHHEHLPIDAFQWRLTKKGQAVRAHLEREKHD